VMIRILRQDSNVRVGAASVVRTRVKCGGSVISGIMIRCISDAMCRCIALVWNAVSRAVAIRMNTLGETKVRLRMMKSNQVRKLLSSEDKLENIYI
jgi:hypothetical protein